jgi:signal transduction histidine kinase
MPREPRRTRWSRFGAVRLRVTAIATALTALALSASALLLVSQVEHRLEDHVNAEANQAITEVADALESGKSFDQAVHTDDLTTQVWIVGERGDVLATTTGTPPGGAIGVGPLPDVAAITGGAPVRVFSRSVEAGGGGGVVKVVAASPLAEVRRSVQELSHLLWFGIPVLVALVGALAWVLVGRALKPVESMRREVDEISHTTLHRRVAEPGSGDEVDRLAQTMNEMLDRLELAADRQRQFVSDASHELRSPLTTIRTQIEVADRHGEATEWESVRGSMLEEVERLDDMVCDLLQLARLEEVGGGDPLAAGAAALATAEVDLDELALREVTRLRSLGVDVDARGITAVRLDGDRAALSRVLRNLADNAARHARSCVAIAVTHAAPADHSDGHAIVRVDDDGPGVPPAERERVFERFTRLDEGRARGAGGAGLGLALVRSVALAHGGSAAVVDSPLGGARFEVILPLPADASLPDAGAS